MKIRTLEPLAKDLQTIGRQSMRATLIALGGLLSIIVNSAPANAQFGIPGGLPNMPGLSSVPNIGRGAGGVVAGAIVAIAMSEMLQQLNSAEKEKRKTALNKAARSGNASWSSGGKESKKATYKTAGPIQEASGKKCQQVTETITLSDGRQASSTETVCFG